MSDTKIDELTRLRLNAGDGRERQTPSPVDGEINRAFIAGWNATLDHTDFDMALHYFMLSCITHVGPASPSQPQVTEAAQSTSEGAA